MNRERLRKNIDALITEGETVLKTAFPSTIATYGDGHPIMYVDSEAATHWSVNALSLLGSMFGRTSEHYCGAAGAASKIYLLSNAKSFHAIVRGALVAWRDEYYFNSRQLIEAEVEMSFIDQAEALLDAGHHRAAVVLAGASLETHLRAIHAIHLPHEAAGPPRTLNPLNTALYKANVYDAAKMHRINGLAAMRNTAAHGEDPLPSVAEIRTMIRDVVAIIDDVK